ncbi:MAG: flagellar biosynthesis protein FlhB [Oscillospiraceae bacterium]|nr:flagellar biosynthesis protein FlhB [Oscillospiraceae bacterium]
MPEQEKTEQATPKKRQDERKKGNIFVSRDITTIVTMIVGFYAISMFIGTFITGIQEFYRENMFRIEYTEAVEFSTIREIMFEFMFLFSRTALPPLLIVGFAAIAATLAQTKLLVSGELIKFKLERLSLIKGFKKFFSIRSIVELVKSLIKIIILIALIYSNIMRIIAFAPNSMDWTLEQSLAVTGQEILAIVRSVAIAFLAVAILDYVYQRWEYERNIKMTKQEVKDDFKNIDGNPEIKAKRREKQREYAMQRMMGAVKEADVVVRNPTHYAVALRYKIDVDIAPTVLAKGVDHVALKIIAEAEKHGVALVENRPLARSLHDLSEIDELVPPELYQPVAEILAWLYSSRNKDRRDTGSTRTAYTPSYSRR